LRRIQVEKKLIVIGHRRNPIRCLLAARRENCPDTGKEGALLNRDILFRDQQCRLRRLDVWIVVERVLNQSIERF